MSKDQLPLITIAISCYNSADTVGDAIDSALAQDWPHKEIIIADDGSSDTTAAVIAAKIQGHDEARLIVYERNKGFASSLNTLIAEAKGAFLAIFDDDDISAPNRVTKQYQRIVEYEAQYGASMVICHTARLQKFPNGKIHYEPTMGIKNGPAPHGRAVVDRIMTGRLSPGVIGSCANCSRMGRIEIFRDLKGYDASMRRAEDTDFNVRLGLVGGHFVGIAEPFVTQTMTMGQEKTLEQEHAAELKVLEKHRGYLEEKGWYSFCRHWLDIRYAYLGNQRRVTTLGLLRLCLRHPIKAICKLYWAIPAKTTRDTFKKWHGQKLN